jgi:hypothetical protein
MGVNVVSIFSWVIELMSYLQFSVEIVLPTNIAKSMDSSLFKKMFLALKANGYMLQTSTSSVTNSTSSVTG